jgi:hypothetical protein
LMPHNATIEVVIYTFLKGNKVGRRAGFFKAFQCSIH